MLLENSCSICFQYSKIPMVILSKGVSPKENIWR